MISGSPLLISAASVCSNLRSMPALIGAGILPVPPRTPQSAERESRWRTGSVGGGVSLGSQFLLGLTMSAKPGEHLRQLPLERGAGQPVRYVARRIHVDA